MSTLTTVRAALVSKVSTVTGLPDLALEGTKYQRKTDTPFVRLSLLPAETQNTSIGENFVLSLSGLAQVDVFYPALRGLDAAQATAESIVDILPVVLLDSGSEQVIIDSVWIAQVREEPSWLHIPVVIRWRAFRNK